MRQVVFTVAGFSVLLAVWRWQSPAVEPRAEPRRIARDHAASGEDTVASTARRIGPAAQQGGHEPGRSTRPVALQDHPVRPAAPEVARVFPGLIEAVEDWREFRPEFLVVAAHPDLPIEFTRTAVKAEGRYVTWIGRNPDLPGASFVGVATAAGYDGIVVLPGASQFSVHVRGEQVVVAEANPAEESCGVEPAQPPRAELGSAANYLAVTYAPGFEPVPDTFAAEAERQVDVLIAYDAETLADATSKSSDPVGYLDGQAKAMIETSNLALVQSGVTAFAWRHLGVVAAPAYARTGLSRDDLAAIAPGGAINDWVQSMCYQRGADQFILLVGGDMDFGGRGYSPKQRVVTAGFALSVMRWGRSYQTLAHELAHNFGCQHDRIHVEVISPGVYGDPAPDADGFWSYGQLWENPPPPPNINGTTGTSGTIMSYAKWRIPYFSNPGITVHVTGEMLGWANVPELSMGSHQLGRPETDPKAAFNVKVLQDGAEAMSNLFEQVVMPAITAHPVGATVTRGLVFNLKVTATGGGLSYQWRKNGEPIDGANTASFSKVSTDADAGDYSVVVKNHFGTVTSNEAAVNIAAPVVVTPPPAAPASAGGGGGGGGGAPSMGFCALLGVLAGLRWFARSRRDQD